MLELNASVGKFAIRQPGYDLSGVERDSTPTVVLYQHDGEAS